MDLSKVCSCLNNEAQIDGTINDTGQIDSALSMTRQINSDFSGLRQVLVAYTGVDTASVSVTVDNTNKTISATLIPYDWLEYEVNDWVQTSSYYKLVVPYATHKCLNAYVAEMLIGSPADSGDAEDEAGYENNIPTWKLLANDSIVVKSDEPVDCKILIKGDR